MPLTLTASSQCLPAQPCPLGEPLDGTLGPPPPYSANTNLDSQSVNHPPLHPAIAHRPHPPDHTLRAALVEYLLTADPYNWGHRPSHLSRRQQRWLVWTVLGPCASGDAEDGDGDGDGTGGMGGGGGIVRRGEAGIDSQDIADMLDAISMAGQRMIRMGNDPQGLRPGLVGNWQIDVMGEMLLLSTQGDGADLEACLERALGRACQGTRLAGACRRGQVNGDASDGDGPDGPEDEVDVAAIERADSRGSGARRGVWPWRRLAASPRADIRANIRLRERTVIPSSPSTHHQFSELSVSHLLFHL